MLRIIIIIFLFCSELIITKIVAQNNFKDVIAFKLDSIKNNPSGKIYFLYNKEISEIDFYTKAFNGELNGLIGTGAEAGKQAISKFGEYYRHGVIFFNSDESPNILPKREGYLPKRMDNNLNFKLHKNEYRLKGRANRVFDEKPVMLFSFADNTILNVDTAIISNGEFTFNGIESLQDIALLSVGNYPDTVISQLVILEQGNILVSLNENKIGGTPLNDLFQSYIDTMKVFNEDLRHIAELDKQQNYIKKGTPLFNKHLEIGNYSVDFKKRNIHNIVGQYFFEKEVGKTISENIAYPSNNHNDSAFYAVYNYADDSFKQKTWIKDYIKEMEKQKELTIEEEGLIGRQFIDFTLTNQSDKRQSISEYMGKSDYTLLDFWASWCAPCIASFPTLKELYEKYDRKKFEIIGVSLDTNKNTWINTVNKENLPWPQLITGAEEGLNNELMERYSFRGIPFTVLVDKEGNIIATGHSVESVRELIK